MNGFNATERAPSRRRAAVHARGGRAMTVLRDAIDTTTLGWVKPELDETLRQARQEIEAFAEDPADSQPHALLRRATCTRCTARCAWSSCTPRRWSPRKWSAWRSALQRRRGRRPRRGLRGADARRRAAARLPRTPAGRPPRHPDRAAAAAQRTARRARRDGPERKRAVRARPRPPAAGRPARRRRRARAGARRSSARAPGRAARCAGRPGRKTATPAHPASSPNAVDGLLGERRCSKPLRRMLWVASSVAGALRDGALPPTRALRQAFAGVEREARQMLADDGFGAPRAEPAAELTRQLLYHVAHSDGRHPALDDLRQTFDLAAHLPSEAELEHARGSLSGRNRALLDTVPAAIKEDLLRVKDALDLHLRTGQTDVADLQPQVEALGRVGDTLGMMGLGVARNVVLQQRDAMHEIVTGDASGRRGRAARRRRRAALRRCLARRPGRAPGPRRRAAPTTTCSPAKRARCSTCSCAKPSPTSAMRARPSSPSSKPTGTTPSWPKCRACWTKSPARCACSNCRSRPTTWPASGATPKSS